jgi:ABC-type branched-subunit amino acid transport system ATPase component/ABC-type branched-subunit amino acid transport system permease subunit
MNIAPPSAWRAAVPILLFGLAYVLVTAFVENSYHLLILAVVPVWAVMGLSWNLFSGYGGLVSFGHAAFFGLGAYFVALAQTAWGLTPWIGIPCAGLVGGLAGLVVGLPTFRLRGHYFALAMLAYPLALLYVFEWLGYQELALPMMRDRPLAFMQFEDHRVYVLLALGLMLGVMLLTSALERARYGVSLTAMKQDEAAAEAAGIDTRAWKLRAIVLSGAIAGAAGGFYAIVLLVVTPPAVFGMLVSSQALIVTMFGGVGTVWGPVIGAVVLVPLSELLHARLGDVVPGIQGVVYGVAIIAVILIAPEGVVWKLRDWRRRRQPTAPDATVARRPPTVTPAAAVRGGRRDVVLDVQGVSKAFGGLRALQDVSMRVEAGEILGVIGPNGAGKTTFFNVLNGFLRPDAGRVVLDGRDVTGWTPHRLCAAGIGRTFQVVRPFRRMTVLENALAGAFVRHPHVQDARAAAHGALERVGLAHIAGVPAGGLSNRDLRLLELARALAGGPRIMLLDETLAGLAAGDVDDVLVVVRALAASGTTIVIIEHTMPAMVRLVDRFVVLDHGAVLTEGLPDAITKDPAVVDAYLGTKWRAGRADD